MGFFISTIPPSPTSHTFYRISETSREKRDADLRDKITVSNNLGSVFLFFLWLEYITAAPKLESLSWIPGMQRLAVSPGCTSLFAAGLETRKCMSSADRCWFTLVTIMLEIRPTNSIPVFQACSSCCTSSFSFYGRRVFCLCEERLI